MSRCLVAQVVIGYVSTVAAADSEHSLLSVFGDEKGPLLPTY